MRKNKVAIFMMAGAMAVTSTITSFAIDISQYYGQESTEIHTGYDGDLKQNYRFSSGHQYQPTGWKWINGYCYYFPNYHDRYHMLKNTVTSDGYAVDEQGRWTLDGVVQYNGYGSLQVGTDSLYAGKDDDTRWLAMRKYLENMLIEKSEATSTCVAMLSYDNSIKTEWPDPDMTIIHNSADHDYIYAEFDNTWNDSPESYGNYGSERWELTLKALCGDRAGQELFNAVRKAAEPAEGGPISQVVFDENGNSEFHHDSETGFTYVDTVQYETSGDGVNFKYMDMGKWGSGQVKTDYGKSIYIEPGTNISGNASQTPSTWALIIK